MFFTSQSGAKWIKCDDITIVHVTHPKCANLVLHDILMFTLHPLDVSILSLGDSCSRLYTESATELKHLLYGIETVETVLSGGLSYNGTQGY